MKRINPATAIVTGVVVVGLLVVYFFGPSIGVSPAAYDSILAIGGIAGTVLAALMRGLLARDEDHDGIPDILEGGPDGGEK